MLVQKSVSRECIRFCWLVTIVSGSMLTFNLSASAQTDPISPRITSHIQRAGTVQKSSEQRKAEMLGILTFTNLTIAFEDVPARQAIKELRKALKINIIGRFSDDSIGHGIDPDALITFEVTDMPALEVLEAIADQCAIYEDCTWQLRSSFVEIGTKRRLAVPGAREVRIYEVKDLLLYVPNFKYENADLLGGNALGQTKYVGTRKTADDLAAELLDLIVDVVEPEAWEQEQKDDDSDNPEDEAPSRILSDPNHPTPEELEKARNSSQYEFDKLRHRRSGQWASAKYWQGKLIVRAPDFLHRQLNGYPKPIPPKEYTNRARP